MDVWVDVPYFPAAFIHSLRPDELQHYCSRPAQDKTKKQQEVVRCRGRQVLVMHAIEATISKLRHNYAGVVRDVAEDQVSSDHE